MCSYAVSGLSSILQGIKIECEALSSTSKYVHIESDTRETRRTASGCTSEPQEPPLHSNDRRIQENNSFVRYIHTSNKY